MNKILITGAAGFVGSHVVEGILDHTDWEVTILDSLTYAGNLKRITDSDHYDPNRVRFVWHDLRAPLKEIGTFDYVFHLAAESHVDRSLEDAIPFAYNVVGTTNLLEYLKTHKPELYIGFNTDEVFGPAPKGVYHSEDDKFRPSNPYAASKAGQWAMEYAFQHSFGLPIIMTHGMNIYAERQHPEKFVPKTIRKIQKGEKMTLHSVKGQFSERKWIHAREVANALIFLTQHGKPGESYNIAGEEKNVKEMAEIIAEAMGKKLKYEEVDAHSQRPGHDLRYSLDSTKLTKLGWQPNYSLKKSLTKTVKWTLNNPEWL